MAYLVLGLGLVMAALGGLAIVSGYPIIQVERGWASVIAGATLLAGGVVTMSLGIVLRTLVDVRGALLAGVTMPVSGQAHGTPASIHAEPAFAMPPEFAAAAPIALAAVPVAAATMNHGDIGSYGHHPEPFHEEASPAHREIIEAIDQSHSADPAYAYEQAHHPAAELEHAGVEAAGDHYALETPSTPDHDLPVAVGAPPGDWLDRAFSELDLQMPEHLTPHHDPAPLTPAASLEPALVPAPPPEHELAHVEHEAASAPHEDAQHLDEQAFAEQALLHHESAEHDHAGYAAMEPAPYDPAAMDAAHPAEEAPHHEAHADEAVADHALLDHVAEHHSPDAAVPHHEEPAPLPHPEPAPAPPIIGRYEADGTSYTMYADGSIAAQSSAGVLHFASMAELKAFIEG